ncbi:MAG TPA: hypothetical protein VFX03_03790, partial [Thermomicrobiales bacterium]|nr:hypothetical protein [Thermomicrobiales bacterium]
MNVARLKKEDSAARSMAPTFILKGRVPDPFPASGAAPGAGPLVSAPFTPAQVRHGYGADAISFDGVSGDGSGQTIAIVDAYNDPNIIADAAAFSTQFALPQFNVSGGPSLTVTNQTGGATLPGDAKPGDWDIEESLDVQWAHAMAPRAN